MDKVVYVTMGTGTALDNLNELLANGWEIMQMEPVEADDCAGCFFWIRNEDE